VLEPWFIFVDGVSVTSQTRMLDMPRLQPGASASALASTLNSLASGRRVLFNHTFERYLDGPPFTLVSNHPDDEYNGKWGLWIENGVATVQAKWTDWFDDFATTHHGVVDHLYTGGEGWGLWKDGDYASGQPFWEAAYWLDQMANPKWNSYQFWGKSMADWLAVLAPSSSFPSNLPAWDSRDHVVASSLYELAVRWWQRKIIHDTVVLYFPNCGFTDYPKFEMTEDNKIVSDRNFYPYTWYRAAIPGNFNGTGLYLDNGRLHLDLYDMPSGVVDGADFDTAFPWVIYAANFVRAVIRSSNYPVLVDVAPRHYNSAPIYSSTDPYYSEAVIHTILNQELPNLLYFNLGDPAYKSADEGTLNSIMTLTQSQCLSANKIVTITKAHVPHNSNFIVSAVYLNNTHSGIARVSFAPGVNSATFTLRDVPFTVARPGSELGAWVSIGPILDLDNLTFDDVNTHTFEQANAIKLGGSNAMSFDEANALTFDEPNALPD
jgi:hypothetical protein